MIRSPLHWMFLYMLLALAGCASLQPPPQPAASEAASSIEAAPIDSSPAPDAAPTGEAAPAVEAAKAVKPELPPASFKPETLYALLVAELAGQRGRYDILLGGYLTQAEATGDAGIAERATRLASYLRADDVAFAAAKLWVEADNDNPEAMQALSIQLVKVKKHHEALALMEKLLDLGEEPRVEYLAVNSQELTQSQRNEMILRFDQLAQHYPDNMRLLFGKTILLQLSGRIQEALTTSLQLHARQQDEQSLQLVARLYHQLGQTTEALALLRQELELNPEQKQARLLYGQLLIDSKDLLQAQQEFSVLVETYPEDGHLRLMLALINLENSAIETASGHLLQLTGHPELSEEAFFYLAQIADQEQDFDSALNYYSQVMLGEKALQAYSRLGVLLLMRNQPDELAFYFSRARTANPQNARALYMLESDLLARDNRAEAAIEILNRALEEYKMDINLLYSRAIAAERLKDLEAMERDFRAILAIEPDNAAVLNALGYTLVNHTDRHDEALQLISRANELKPNDPAITDSLGWVFYHMGQYEEAVRLLTKAFADFPDHEVAAHLGEALWAIGKKEKAQAIWHEALRKQPDSEIIRETMERLGTELPE